MTGSCCWLRPCQTRSALLSEKATERAGSLVRPGASAEMFGERCRAPAELGVSPFEFDVVFFCFFPSVLFFLSKAKLSGRLQQSL